MREDSIEDHRNPAYNLLGSLGFTGNLHLIPVRSGALTFMGSGHPATTRWSTGKSNSEVQTLNGQSSDVAGHRSMFRARISSSKHVQRSTTSFQIQTEHHSTPLRE